MNSLTIMAKRLLHVLKALGEIKLPLLIPVLRPLVILILVTAALFPTDTIKRLVESSVLGILVCGCLLLALIIASVTTTQKSNELLWLQDHKDKSIFYLRILPVYKLELWLAKVTITMIVNFIVMISVTLAFFFGLPYLFNLLESSWTHWGLAWWQHLSSSEIGVVVGSGLTMIVIVFYALGLLSAGAYVPVARRGGKEFNKVLISNKYVKTDVIVSFSFVMIFCLAAYFYFNSIPLIYLFVVYVELLFIQYLCSYLIDSGVNLTLSKLSSTLAIGLLAGLVVAGIAMSLLYSSLTSEDFLLRSGSYFLTRPIGTERFSNNIISKLEALGDDNRSLTANYTGLLLVDKHDIAGARPKFLTMVDDPNCLKRRMAQDLLTLERARDNLLTAMIIDARNYAVFNIGDKKQCRRSPKEVAEFLFHTTTVDRQITFIKQALQSTEHEQRMVAAYLVAKLPVTDKKYLSYFQLQILKLLGGVCDSRASHGDANKRPWQVELAAYDLALTQLTLNTPFALDFPKSQNSIEGYCSLIRDEAISYWKDTIEALRNESSSYTNRFNQKLFHNASNSAAIEDASMITEAEFHLLLPLIDWTQQPPQIKCHLAQQWKLLQGTPSLDYTDYWIQWPRDFFGESAFERKFSDSDCITATY